MSVNRVVRRAGQTGLVLAVAGLATVLAGGNASAHVTAKVLGESAEQGGYTKITFRVPNERDNAGTVKLQINLPAEHPISSVRAKPIPGWTAAITKVKLAQPVRSGGTEITAAVSTVTWTASTGTRIGPGEFGEFEVSAGRLPDNTDQLVIPAVQTYDNGEVVSWDAPPAEGAEPERPAPVVPLTPATGADEHGDHAAPAGGDLAQAGAAGQDDTARWLGGAGLAVGALGLGVGAGATLRARRAVTAAKSEQRS